MNIAHLLPTTAVFPLKKHNGRYEWALRLAKAQVASGHTVTVYAGIGSHDNSAIIWQGIPVSDEPKKTRNMMLMSKAFNQKSHDVYHSHFDSLHFITADLTEKPVIVTQHWYPSPEIAKAVQFNKNNNVITVPVTDMMRRENVRLGIPSADRIYHGIDLSLFRPSSEHTDRFLFVGRIHPSKGVTEAIHYAKTTGINLDIIGKVNATETVFWHSLQTSIDGKQIAYLGQQSQDTVAIAYAKAKALLFPSQINEAFGQVTVEAQAAGTPVIISNIGASSELVIQDKTGFICSTDDDYINAINNIDLINRDTCRENAKRFNFTDMVNAYENLYKSAI